MGYSPLHKALETQLERRRRNGSLRALRRRSIQSDLHEFSSNDYLDLAKSPILRALFSRYLEAEENLASTGSRLLSGNSQLANDIEATAKEYWQCEETLLCASGYEANVSIFNTIPQIGDTVIYDELIHASVHVGLKTSRATRKLMFRHNDINHLRQILRREHCSHEAHNVFVAVETVYSMDGDIAPLQKVIQAIRCECPQARVILDEAHATGVFGSRGRGLAWSLNLQLVPEILLRLHTLGKGAGGTGAIIICDHLIKQYLLNYAKGLIYSTFMSMPALALARASIGLLQSGQTERLQDALWSRVEFLQSKLPKQLQNGNLVLPTRFDSPIIPIMTPSAVELSVFLEHRGFRVMPVRYPTVPRGQERVRICLRASIEFHVIDSLIDALADWVMIHEKNHSKIIELHKIGNYLSLSAKI